MTKRPVSRRRAKQVSLPAPISGLVEGLPSVKGGAEVLENFIPTTRGVKVRGGTQQYAYIRRPVQALFGFAAGGVSRLFAASDTAIIEASAPNASATTMDAGALKWGAGQWGAGKWGRIETPVASGFTSGRWTAQQIGTSGGDYMIAVNGSDRAQLYDGTAFNPLTSEAVSDLPFDRMTAAFSIGETLTGETSGASASIVGLVQITGATGALKIGAVSGVFEAGERILSTSGAAFASGVASVASPVTVTGVDTSTLSHVWIYRDRLFFVKRDSLKAYYLPVASIGGAAQDVSLSGVFQRGGKLLLGATWSLDSGDGMDDKCVFVSDRGEAAIYSGADPSDASTWRYEGRYEVGTPLGKNATMRVGGDLLIATDEGIVPLSAALQKDPADLSLHATTRAIESTWRNEVARTGGHVQLIKWTKGDLTLACFPDASHMLTANLNTAAWAMQTGWHGTCGATFETGAFVGRDDGSVIELDTGGTDLGQPFTARLCFSFQDFGNPAAYKQATMMRGGYFADDDFRPQYGIASDYSINWSAAPNSAPSTTGAMKWGATHWGAGTWARDIDTPRKGKTENWRSVTGEGSALAPMVQITSGGSRKLPVELIRVDLLAETGGLVT